MDFPFLDTLTAHGSIALFGLLVLGIVGLPVPDETLLIAAGVLVSHHQLGRTATYAAALAGAIVGITVSYMIGRGAGVTVIRKYGSHLRLPSTRVEHVRGFFQRSGRWFLMFGYFVPGIRHVTALVAGAAGIELPFFARYAYVGAGIWSLSFLTLGLFLGDRWRLIADRIHRGDIIAFLVIVGAVALLIALRSLRARWQRRTARIESDTRTGFSGPV